MEREEKMRLRLYVCGQHKHHQHQFQSLQKKIFHPFFIMEFFCSFFGFSMLNFLARWLRLKIESNANFSLLFFGSRSPLLLGWSIDGHMYLLQQIRRREKKSEEHEEEWNFITYRVF